VISYVVIATTARVPETLVLLDHLSAQTAPPKLVFVVGAKAEDLTGMERHPLARSGIAKLIISPTLGLTSQRNAGIAALRQAESPTAGRKSFVAFFDDDFRPAPLWLENCAKRFSGSPDVVALTGRLLADGVKSEAISEEESQAFLSGRREPLPHWSDRAEGTEVTSLYGCNMAVVDDVISRCTFDERLPLYGWQEDCDFAGQAWRLGRVIIDPNCVGVHLGTKSGRTSGLRFGYSQIANPIRIASRGNMPHKRAIWFMVRALASNVVHSVTPPALFDYRGRLRGNLIALRDLAVGRCDPLNVLQLR
jgi:GT2 family glycosyltransferase